MFFFCTFFFKLRKSKVRKFGSACILGFNVFSGYYGLNPYPMAFPYGNGMVLHFYQQQESSTTKTVHKVINKGLKAYV